MLIAVLDAIERGAAFATPQPEAGVTYAPRLTRGDGRVNWAQLRGVDIDRMVRALQPWPGVVASIADVDVQLRAGRAAEIPLGAAPGSIVRYEGESAVIAAREGGYRADLIVPPGRRAMTPAAFLRGRRTAPEHSR